MYMYTYVYVYVDIYMSIYIGECLRTYYIFTSQAEYTYWSLVFICIEKFYLLSVFKLVHLVLNEPCMHVMTYVSNMTLLCQ